MNVLEVDLHKLTVSDPFLGQYQPTGSRCGYSLPVGCVKRSYSRG